MRTSALPGSQNEAARRIAVRTASPPPSRRRSSRRGGNTRAGVPASCSYGSPTAARGSSCPQQVRRAISCTAGDSCGGAAAAEPGSIRARPNSLPRGRTTCGPDFKGHFRTGDGAYCYPLTVADQHSRYLLACDALASVRTEDSWLVFDRLFRDVGLPRAIRTDNGAPFCSTGIHGLCAMNVWWIRLGIAQQRIAPSHPEQNGAHERMHRTLKAETARPPARTRRGQQRRFQRFRAEY